MRKTHLLKDYSSDNTSNEEKIELIKHIDVCKLCQKQLKKNFMDKSDMFRVILGDLSLATTDIFDDPEAKKCINRIVKKTKKIVQQEREKIEAEKTWFQRLLEFKIAPILIPKTTYVIASTFLILVASTYFYTISKKPPYTGIKGTKVLNKKITLSLKTIKYGNDGKVKKFNDVIQDVIYQSSTKILFKFTLEDYGYVYLVHMNLNGTIYLTQPVNDDFPLQPGIHNLMVNKEIKPYSMKGLTGKQYFIGVYSKEKVTNITQKAASIAKKLIKKGKIDDEKISIIEITVK